MAYMKSYPNQNYLIPPKLTDLFSEDHVCYLIELIAKEMDYSCFDEKYAGAGHPAYHPRICLKLLAMAYIDGLRSSRRIAKNAMENVVYIFLAEKAKPDFRTISDFRKDNPKLVKSTFKQLAKFAYSQGLIDLSHLMIDGTKIKADANDDKNIDKKTLEKLEKYIDRVVEEGIRVDEEEDKLYGDKSFHQLPEELNDKEKRRRVVREIVDEINKSMKVDDKTRVQEIKSGIQELRKTMDEKGLKKYSFTDPNSRFMINKKGKIQLSYNTQITVDKNGLIIANDAVQQCDDRNQLLPNVRSVEETFGKLPKGTKISVDNHYGKGEGVQVLDDEGIDIYVPLYGMHKEVKNKFDKINFEYDEKKDIYICPEGKPLKKSGTYFNKRLKKNITIYRTSTKDCANCPHKQECCKTARVRQLTALPQDKLLNRIKTKMQTPEGKATYNLRKQTVETAFGDIKQNKKFTDFILRGLEKVKIEWDLVCIASNLVKINNLLRLKNMSLAQTC